MTSYSTFSSCWTSSRARSSAMLDRSRSSSIAPLAPGEGGGTFRELLCQYAFVVATHQDMGFQPRIFEVIHLITPFAESQLNLSDAIIPPDGDDAIFLNALEQLDARIDFG